MPINRPATNRGGRGENGLKTEVGGVEGWGSQPGSRVAVGDNLGLSWSGWCRVLREGGASSKPPLGRNWGPDRGGMNQIGPLRDWAGLTPGRSQLPVATAGSWRFPSFLDFLSYQLFSASLVCQPRRQPLEVSVAVFLHFSWFVSACAVSRLSPSPRVWSFSRASVSETCLTQRLNQPERDGEAGVPRRWVWLEDWRASHNVRRNDCADRFGSTLWV